MKNTNKRKSIIVTMIAAFCFILLMPLTSTATTPTNEGVKESTKVRIVANEEQLKILNELQGTNVTFGEVIRKVYPEAVKSILPDTMSQMDKTPMQWITNDTILPQSVNVTSDNEKTSLQTQPQIFNEQNPIMPMSPPPILVGCESNISNSGYSIDYDSGSRVWSPTPWYDIPSMCVLAQLKEKSSGSIVDSAFESDTNCHEISASRSYNGQKDEYMSIGYHYGTFPAGSNPSGYATTTSRGWISVP